MVVAPLYVVNTRTIFVFIVLDGVVLVFGLFGDKFGTVLGSFWALCVSGGGVCVCVCVGGVAPIFQNYSQMSPKRFQYASNIIPILSRNGPNRIPKRFPNGPKTIPN